METLNDQQKQQAEITAKEKKLKRRGGLARFYSVDDIQLSDEERRQAYRDFITESQSQTGKTARYWKSVFAKRPPEVITAEDLYPKVLHEMKKSVKDFVFDHVTKQNLSQIVLYFAKDRRFFGDLEKGLLLRGKVGCGKTSMIKLFDPKFTTVINCQKVINDYEQYGLEAVRYLEKAERQYCFNDLGTEDKAQRFKTINLIGNIIFERAERGLITHYTTNCTDSELIELYEQRIFSRIAGFSNLISWGDTEDRRLN